MGPFLTQRFPLNIWKRKRAVHENRPTTTTSRKVAVAPKPALFNRPLPNPRNRPDLRRARFQITPTSRRSGRHLASRREKDYRSKHTLRLAANRKPPGPNDACDIPHFCTCAPSHHSKTLESRKTAAFRQLLRPSYQLGGLILGPRGKQTASTIPTHPLPTFVQLGVRGLWCYRPPPQPDRSTRRQSLLEACPEGNHCLRFALHTTTPTTARSHIGGRHHVGRSGWRRLQVVCQGKL